MTTNLELIRSVPERRMLWLRGKITENRAKKLISELRRLNRGSKPILLRVNSKGGSLRWALQITEAIQSLRVPVYALVTKAHSGALLIVQVCDLRIGKPESKYCIHYNKVRLDFLIASPYMDTDALKTFIDNTIEPFLREMWMPAHAILLDRVLSVGKSEEELSRFLREDTIVGVRKAIEWGFIDEVANIKFPRG